MISPALLQYFIIAYYLMAIKFQNCFMKVYVSYFILLAFFSTVGYGQFRKYSNEFLNIGAGARSMGMGGAQIASANDATAGYWNPAALADIKDDPSLSLMHAEYFAGIGKYDFGAVAIPMKQSNRTLGISILRFAVDDIPNTLFLVQPDGSVNYGNIQTFSSADYAFLFSLAQTIKLRQQNKQLNVGVNAKIIYRNVGTFAKAWGFGIDAAVRYHFSKWTIGAVLKDATTTFNAWSFTFSDKEKEILYLTKNDIPAKSTELTAPRLSVGGSYTFTLNKKTTLNTELALDATFDGKRNTLIYNKIASIDPKIGVEINISNTFFLRGGLYNFQRGLKDGDTTNQKKVWIYQPCIGAGFKFGNVGIDYAFNNLANQSSPLYSHIISLKVDFIKKEK